MPIGQEHESALTTACIRVYHNPMLRLALAAPALRTSARPSLATRFVRMSSSKPGEQGRDRRKHQPAASKLQSRCANTADFRSPPQQDVCVGEIRRDYLEILRVQACSLDRSVAIPL